MISKTHYMWKDEIAHRCTPRKINNYSLVRQYLDNPLEQWCGALHFQIHGVMILNNDTYYLREKRVSRYCTPLYKLIIITK